jgi:hypothetical protein
MLSVDDKVIQKKNLNEGKDRYVSVKNKEMGSINPYKKPNFTGKCEELKDCIFDCEGDKLGGTFEANLKKLVIYAGTKYDIGSKIMTMIDELVPVSMKNPEPYKGTYSIKEKIYELQIAQYIKSQAKFESDTKKFYAVITGQCTEYMLEKRNLG